MARTFYFSANRTSPLPKAAVRRMFVSSLLLCVGIGEGAQACSVFYPQEARAQRPYDRIVAATIIQAAYTGPHEPHLEPWEATAKVISNAQGVPKDRIFKLYRTGSHGGGDCDDGEPLPKIGQTWILYLNRNARQQYPDYPTYSLPFAKARKMDPRFGAPKIPRRNPASISEINAALDARNRALSTQQTPVRSQTDPAPRWSPR